MLNSPRCFEEGMSGQLADAVNCEISVMAALVFRLQSLVVVHQSRCMGGLFFYRGHQFRSIGVTNLAALGITVRA